MTNKPFSFYSKAIWGFVLPILFLLSLCLPAWTAQTKGIEVVFKDRQGKDIGLYKGSYALLIGASQYTKGWRRLPSVPHEVDAVKTALEAQGFEVQVISDPDAKRLEEAFKSFIGKYGYDRENRLFFFFSGHGYTRKQGKKGYLVPVDAPDPREDEKGFLRKALSMGQIQTWAKQMEVKHSLFAFDSCFSGTIFTAKDHVEVPPHITDKTARTVRQFITAGDMDEPVPSVSVFTPSLVRGLEGEGDLDGDGYVTGTELRSYLHKKVLSYRTGQTPQWGKLRDPDYDQGDFVFQVASSGAVVDRPGSPTTLSVSCNMDGASVYVDGQQIGRTPLQDEAVAAGQRSIRVEKSGYEPYQKRINMDAGRAVFRVGSLRSA